MSYEFEDYIKEAEDIEVAIFVYSLEKEVDNKLENTEEYLKVGYELLGIALREYKKRELHYTMFTPDDTWPR